MLQPVGGDHIVSALVFKYNLRLVLSNLRSQKTQLQNVPMFN